MRLFSWLRKLFFQRPAKSAGRHGLYSGARLSLKKLEDRRVLSVSATVTGGVLDIAIASTFTNTQHIDTTNDVAITVQNSTGNVLVNGQTITVGTGTLHATDVTSINVHDATTTANTINLSGVTVGAGFDNAAGVQVHITGGNVSGGGTYSITGSGFNDTINVGTGNNTLVGGGGNDTFIFSSSFGNDTISNNAGTNNTLDLSAVTADITVNLQSHTATSSTNTLSFQTSTISSVIGNSNASNTFQGLDAASTWTIGAPSDHYTATNADVTVSGFDTLQGGSSNDTFNFVADSTLTVRGGAGNDTFNLSDGIKAGHLFGGGSTGTDTLNYSAYTTGITVSLTDGTATNVLSITGLENVTGGSGNDSLTGDGNANVLDGGSGGLDVLFGGTGNDTLINGYQSDGEGGTDTIHITRSIVANNGNNISLVAETINLDANLSTATAANSGSVLLTGPVILGADVSITTHNSGAGTDGNVTFSSTINSDSTARSLTIDAGTGALTVTGAIGGSSLLSSMSITSAGTVSLQSDVATQGAFTQIAGTGDTTIAGSLDTQNGAVSITTSGSISFDNISAGAGSNDVTLIAGSTGSVTMATGTTNEIVANNVSIQSGSGGIGSSTQHIRIDATTISATAANADVYLDDVGSGLTIASGGLSAGTGTIFLGDGTFTSGGSNRISDSSVVSLGSGTKLALNGFSDSIGGLDLVSGTTSGSTVTTGVGTLTLLGDVALAVSGTGTVGASISGKLSLGSATRTMTVADGSASNDLSISAAISGTGSAGLTKAGSGNLLLSGSNTFTGTTSINAGTITASGGSAISDSGGVTIDSAGTFALSTDETIGALNGAGSVVSASATGVRDLTVTGGGTFSGVISDGAGTVALAVNSSANTLVLSGTNTYTGTTTVQSGTLQLDGSVTSNISVASGATLSGSGTVNGNVTSSGTVSPGGTGVGILTISGNLSSSGTIRFDANSGWTTAGTDYDQIVVSGTLNLNGSTLAFQNTDNSSPPPVNQLLTLISHTSGAQADPTKINGGTSPADGSTITIGTHLFKIFYNGGDGNDVVLFEASAPTVVYVSNTAWNGVANGIAVDGDLGTIGVQVAIIGVNAFTSVNSGLSAVSASGQAIINSGTYNENVNLTGTQTLTVTTAATVTFSSLSAVAGTTIQINGASLAFGSNNADTTIAADINGSGNLIKQGTGTVTLSGDNGYSGTTSINGGTVILGSSTALGSTAGGTTVSSGAVLDLDGQSVGAEALSINGTGSSSNGALINSSTTAGSLTGAITLAGNASIGGTGNLTLAGLVKGTTADTQSLTLVGSGTKKFTNTVGQSVSLNSITQSSSAGAVEFDQDVIVGSGGATFNGNLILDSMTFSSGGPVVVGSSAANTFVINGGPTAITTTNGSVTLNGTTTAYQNLALTAGGSSSDLSVNSTITGDANVNLALSAGRTSTIGGNVSTTGTGTVSIAGSNGITVATGVTVSTSNRQISLAADSMTLNGNLNAGTGPVALRQQTNGTSIDLGGADVVGPPKTLGLTATELSHVTASNLTIGNAQSGAIVVSSDISLPNINTLDLRSGSSVTATQGGVVVSNLAVVAGGAVNFSDTTTDVSKLAILTTTGNVTFVDANQLNIGIVDGISGVSTNLGSVGITVSSGNLTVENTSASSDISATTGVTLTVNGTNNLAVIAAAANIKSTGGGIAVIADNLDLSGTITAPGQAVTLAQRTNGQLINLGGGDAAGTLGLTASEINNVTADKLVIGNPNSGAITISADVSATNVSTVHLITGSSIQGTVGGISANQLAISALGDVVITAPSTNVATLGIQTSGGLIRFANSGGLNIDSVDGVVGLNSSASSGDISVNAGGPINLNQAVNAGAGVVRLSTATGGVSQLASGGITASALGVINGGNGDILLLATNHVGQFSAANSGANGAIKLVDAGGVSVRGVGADGPIFAGVNGLSTTNGDVTLSATGPILIDGMIGAGAGTVRLKTTSGGISQNAGDTIAAGALSANNAGIGNILLNEANDVRTIAISNIAAGTIQFRDTGSLTIGTVTADGTVVGANTGVVTGDATHQGGDISIGTNGDLTVNQAVSTSGGSGGATTIQGATLNAPVTAGAGNIGLMGNGQDLVVNVAQNASGSLSYSAQRDVLVHSAVTALSNVNIQSTGNTVLDSTITSTNGSIVATVHGQMTAHGTLMAAKDVRLQSDGPLTLDRSVSGGQDVSLISTQANVQLDGGVNAGRDVDIQGLSTIVANAALAAGNHMQIKSGGVTTLSSAADITAGSAGLTLSAAQLLTGGDISTTSGVISITAPVVLTNSVSWTTTANANDPGANVTVQGPIDGTIPNTQDLTLTAGAGNIEVTGNVGALTPLGNVLVNTANTTLFDGKIIADSYQQLAGSTTIFAGDVVTFGTVQALSTDGFQFTGQSLQFVNGTSSLDTTGHDVTITANSLILPTTFLNAMGKTVTIHTLSDSTTIGLNDASQNLNIAGNQLAAIHTNNLVIGQSSNTGGIKIGTDGPVTVSSNVQMQTAGNLNVNGPFSVAGTNTITAIVGTDFGVAANGRIETDAGNLQLTVGRDMSIVGVVHSNAGSQTIFVTHDLSSSGAITSIGGNILIDVGHQLSFGSTSLNQTATGDFTVRTGTSTLAGDGSLFMANGAVINAGTGRISLTANGDVTLGQIATNNGTVDAVRVTANNSAIIDGGNGTTPNIVALDPNAIVTLRAATGIGSGAGPALKTNVSNLDVVNAATRTVAASGDVRIDDLNPNGVVIRQVDQEGAGAVAVTSQGTMIVAASAAGGSGVHSRAGSLTLSAIGPVSSVDIRSAIDTTGGSITLGAANSVLIGEVGLGAATSIRSQGGDVTVLAGNNPATTGQVLMQDGSVVNAGAGQIGIHAQGDVVLGQIATTNSTSTAVTIESRAGGLVNGGNSNGANIEANAVGSVVNITTHTGIGSVTGFAPNPQLETHVAALNIVNGSPSAPLGIGTPAIDVNIVESDSLSIQQIVQNNMGSVHVTAAQNIDLGRITGQPNPNSVVSITSLQGGIVNSQLAGASNVVAGSLALRAATGIGTASPIQTEVGALSASNSSSGGIQIANVSGALLSVNSIDGMIGVTNAGSSNSNISISNNSSISIDAAITNLTGGNILVQANGTTADIIAHVSVTPGTNGDVTMLAGRDVHILDSGPSPEIAVSGDGTITLNALQGRVILDPNVQLVTSTGAVSAVPPVITNIQAPPLSGVGQATIKFTYGTPGDRNLNIEVIWGEGVGDLAFNAATAGTIEATHVYGRNPNAADPAADIQVILKIDFDPSVRIVANGVDQTAAVYHVILQPPTTGLATYATNLAPPVAYLTIPEIPKVLGVVQQTVAPTLVNSSDRIDSIIGEQAVAAERVLAIELLSPDKKVQMEIKLPESTLDEIITVIQKLPDGNYRFQLQEPGEERQRLLLEFEVRQGKIVDHNDDSFRPPSSTKIKKILGVEPRDDSDGETEIEEGGADKIESPTETVPPLPIPKADDAVSFNGDPSSTGEKDGHDTISNGVSRSAMMGRRAWKRIGSEAMDASSAGDASSGAEIEMTGSSMSTDASSAGTDEGGDTAGAAIMVTAASAMVFPVSQDARRQLQQATSGLSRMARHLRKSVADLK